MLFLNDVGVFLRISL